MMNMMIIAGMKWERELEQKAQMPHSRRNPPFVLQLTDQPKTVERSSFFSFFQRKSLSEQKVNCLSESC
jgi:hypothetical protein